MKNIYKTFIINVKISEKSALNNKKFLILY